MLRLVSVFVDIALHRRGPDVLPASTFMLGLAVAAYVSVFLLTLLLADTAPAFLVAAFAVDTVLGVLLTWSLLRAFARERRLMQTITALLGINALITAVALPILLSARSLEQLSPETERGVYRAQGVLWNGRAPIRVYQRLNGVLTDWFLFCDNSMRIAPPLTINEDQIRDACKIILRSIDEAVGR